MSEEEHVKYGLSADALSEIQNKVPANLNRYTLPQIQGMKMDHLFDNDLDGDYTSDASVFLNPVAQKDKGLWSAREEARKSVSASDIYYTAA